MAGLRMFCQFWPRRVKVAAVSLSPHGLRELRDGEVVDRPLQTDGAAHPLVVAARGVVVGHVAALDVLADPRPFLVRAWGVVHRSGALDQVLQRLLEVEVAGTEGIEVRDEWDGVVARHLPGVVVGQGPARPPAALFGIVDERLRHVTGLLRPQHRLEGRQRAVGVPVGEVGVLVVARGQRAHLVVEAGVASVGVVEGVRVHQRVVERGVERLQLTGVAPGDADRAQRGGPLVAGLPVQCVQAPARHLGRHVGLGAVHGDVRHGDLGPHRARVGRPEGEVGARLGGVHGVAVLGDRLAVPGAVRGERAVEGDRVVDRVLVALATEVAGRRGPGDLPVADDAQVGALVAGETGAALHEHLGRVRPFGERELRQSRTRGGGQFGPHLRVSQRDRVVTGFCLLVVVREGLGPVPRGRADVSGHGQDRHVAEGRAADRGVVEAEAADLVAVVLVSGVRACRVRRELHHAERGCGAGKVVDLADARAAPARADERVHVGGGVVHQ